jgi:hypothetical protein
MAKDVMKNQGDDAAEAKEAPKQAWVIEVEENQLQALSHTFSSDVHTASVPKEQEWVVVVSKGNIGAIARVNRTRRELETATMYFDRLQNIEEDATAEKFGVTVPALGGILRVKWDDFESICKALLKAGLEELKPTKDRVHVRHLLELASVDDLLGPANGPLELIIDMSARERYLVGKLSPIVKAKDEGLKIEAGGEVDDQDDSGEENTEFGHEAGAEFPRASGRVVPEDDSADEADTSDNQSLVPSSFGLTFVVDPGVTSISVDARWGRYEKVANDDHDYTKQFKNKETGGIEETKVRVWQRVPCGGQTEIPVIDGPISPRKPDKNESKILIQGACRTNPQGECIVTLFIVNTQAEPEENKDEAWVFQPVVTVSGGAQNENQPIFLRRRAGKTIVDDFEKEKLSLIYRNRLEFAVGHGVSVHAVPSIEAPTRAAFIRTEVMPSYEVAATETPGEKNEDRPAMREMVANGWLDMTVLAGMEREDLSRALGHLIGDYQSWIEEQSSRIGVDVVGHDEAATDVIEKCRETLTRLQEGLNVLESDEAALEAFRFANKAMALQRVRSIFALSRRRGEKDIKIENLDIPRNRSWRAFQLAFLLLSVPSLTDPKHPDRTEPLQANADLLWFPTGGGKTEAYLGVAAFAMAMRRLRHDLGDYDGTQGLCVIMRYTLRLLTLQQFQRATILLCAMEIIRREDTPKWGLQPFTLGLWVGNKVTPGTTEESAQAVQSILDGYQPRRGSPVQLTSCPWCGGEIQASPRNFVVDQKTKRTSIFCGDPFNDCDFCKEKSKNADHPGLPVTVVDEELYHRPPTMMIATVDKFAMMSWRQESRTLFGRAEQSCQRHGLLWPGHDCGTGHRSAGRLGSARVTDIQKTIRPPDLIIQDEFHLISGPLGTMVGLYETAIDELSSWNLDGKSVRPKIVASTATVRKADEQMQNVFMRNVSIFPPTGLDVEDNFFSVQRPTSQVYGRKYMGICAPGSSRPAVLIRAYTAFLTASQALFETFGAIADPYMSLVGYFNSLRELGGMRRLAEDDVRTRCYRVAMSLIHRPGLAQRGLSGLVAELTSRVPSAKIPEYLDQLELQFGEEFDEERGKFKTRWDEGLRPIDVVLATNMLSVGVDVNRLGLMVVNGQPKGTAEYIQATSRVGRSFPGLVASVLTWARPRDLSHYETFEHYHATFYQHVEAQSATPFSPRAIDRGLTGMSIALVRAKSTDLAPNGGATLMRNGEHAVVAEAVDLISNRAWTVTQDPNRRQHATEAMKWRSDDWVRSAKVPGRDFVYSKWRAGDRAVSLMKEPGQGEWTEWTAPTSMREVEPGVSLMLDDRISNFDSPWQENTNNDGDNDA